MDINRTIFISLFNEAYEKCFGFPMTSSLSEADSKIFSNTIFECTGLVIGSKSIKNYSLSILNGEDKGDGKGIPTVATLDTLARYVLNAPYTDEISRKDNESHYPYWFEYRRRFSDTLSKRKPFKVSWKRILLTISSFFILGIVLFVFKNITLTAQDKSFRDDFDSVSEDSLILKGWHLKDAEPAWWHKRNDKPGHLALFTLKGDNWGLGDDRPKIKNLLMREVPSNSYMVEIHLTDFIPGQNWQQAGIILSEDSTLTGKMLRLSIAYNDFFGGYKQSPEIILQAISSTESEGRSQPQEVVHLKLFGINENEKDLIRKNLRNTALKIEKKDNHFRLLYSVSPLEIYTFKEATSGDFNFQPKYVSIFSIQGWANDENPIPAYFDSFAYIPLL